MTRAFRLNLTALSLLALLCGAFLIYNTMTFSVVQRRPLLGMLRALGVTRAQVFTLVLAEAAVGPVGTAAGFALGVALGRGLVRLVTQTINDLYFVLSVRELALAGAPSPGAPWASARRSWRRWRPPSKRPARRRAPCSAARARDRRRALAARPRLGLALLLAGAGSCAARRHRRRLRRALRADHRRRAGAARRRARPPAPAAPDAAASSACSGGSPRGRRRRALPHRGRHRGAGGRGVGDGGDRRDDRELPRDRGALARRLAAGRPLRLGAGRRASADATLEPALVARLAATPGVARAGIAPRRAPGRRPGADRGARRRSGPAAGWRFREGGPERSELARRSRHRRRGHRLRALRAPPRRARRRRGPPAHRARRARVPVAGVFYDYASTRGW